MMKSSCNTAMNRNRILRAILICMLILLVVIAGGMFGIHAYLTDTDSVINTMTAGNNTIQNVTDENGQLAVQNMGNVDCFVRVFAEVEEPGAELNVTGSGWTAKQADGYYYYETALKPSGEAGDTTTGLCESVEGLIFYAESIQAEGFADAQSAFAK